MYGQRDQVLQKRHGWKGGKVKFVKHALNIGSIRNRHQTMLAAVNLACRFGQPQVLDMLLHKVRDQFFKINYFNFAFTDIAGISEARRLEASQSHEPSGIIDILIKYARKSFDERKLEWVSGKIDLEEKKVLGNIISTPFNELCGKKNSCMGDVIKKILDAEGYLLDVNEVIDVHNATAEYSSLSRAVLNGEKDVNIIFDGVGDSALSHAILIGEKDVIKIILDKMMCKDSTHNSNDENPAKFQKTNEHIQDLVHLLMRSITPNSTSVFEREDIVDVFEMLIEHCLTVTQENEIGHDNAILMLLMKVVHSHDHLDTIVFEIIERERRIAHFNGKLTWFDLYDFQTVQDPIGTKERYFRSVSVNGRNRIKGNVPVDLDYLENIIQFIKDQEKKSKCWSCGHNESGMMVCKQCREARYCDATCQDENWDKHQLWCREAKSLLMKERQQESEEERESRRLLRSYTNDWKKKNSKQAPALWIQMATVFQNMCELAKNGKYYF